MQPWSYPPPGWLRRSAVSDAVAAVGHVTSAADRPAVACWEVVAVL